MSLKLHELETARFGVVTAWVSDNSAHTEEIDVQAKSMGVQLLITRVPATDLHRLQDLEAAGYRLMDTLVYYTRDVSNPPHQITPPKGFTFRLATSLDKEEVARVAKDCFASYIGHYHADPHLDQKAADAAYVEWAEICTERTSPTTPVIVAMFEEKIVGFLAMRTNSRDEMEIILNGVAPAFQGRGVYSSMTANAISLANMHGSFRLITSTQITNYKVQKVWTQLGFFHTRSLYTLHKWF